MGYEYDRRVSVATCPKRARNMTRRGPNLSQRRMLSDKAHNDPASDAFRSDSAKVIDGVFGPVKLEGGKKMTDNELHEMARAFCWEDEEDE